MARKENQWIKSERVGEVALFLSPRSPYWRMYWVDGLRTSKSGKSRTLFSHSRSPIRIRRPINLPALVSAGIQDSRVHPSTVILPGCGGLDSFAIRYSQATSAARCSRTTICTRNPPSECTRYR